ASGGGTTKSSSANGSHRHLVFGWNSTVGNSPDFPLQSYTAASTATSGANLRLLQMYGEAGSLYTEGAADNHSHSVEIPSHTHDFNIPNHNHSVNIPNHTHQIDIPNHSHDVTIPAHSHSVTIPDHTHEIEL